MERKNGKEIGKRRKTKLREEKEMTEEGKERGEEMIKYVVVEGKGGREWGKKGRRECKGKRRD